MGNDSGEERGEKEGRDTYVSAALPTTILTLVMSWAARASPAILASSGSNSRPVTVPSGPTAWDHTMAE